VAVRDHERNAALIYGRDRTSRAYRWWRATQARAGNATLFWMARRFRNVSARQGHRIGITVGTLLRRVSPRHHRLVLKNLHIAFGREKSEAELGGIAAACYRHLGKSLMEFIRLPAMTPDDIRRVAEMRGAEHIDEALARGKGIILLTGHVGNWEITGARIAAQGYTLNVIARPQREDALTDLLLATREAAGMKVYHRGSAVKASLAAFRRNELVGVLLDQNAGEDGVFVEFFGHLASTAAGAAVFALRTEAAVLPTFGWRNPDNTHTVVIDPPVPLIRTDDYRQDIVANTAQYTRIIEGKIRAHPEQWFWLHKRWKSRPPEERSAGPAQ
jgi:KDO2-lipid IV(A) lauroyltransferase